MGMTQNTITAPKNELDTVIATDGMFNMSCHDRHGYDNRMHV